MKSITDEMKEDKEMLVSTDNKTENKDAQQAGRNTLKKIGRGALALFVIAAAGALVWYFLLRTPATSPNIIKVSGRIEGDDAAVSSKISGRLRELTVREGDTVKAGQVIATLDDEQVRAREQQESSAVQQAEARMMRAQQQVAVLQAELAQSSLSMGQARTDAEGRVHEAEARVAAAEAQFAQAEAAYGQARYDEERYTTLASDGDVPERTGKQARSSAEAQAAAVRAARKQVDAARGALIAVKASLANPAIHSSHMTAVRQQIIQAQSDIDAAQAETEKARAKLREAQADRNDLQIIAPFDGTVATRTAEPGEVITAGTPIVTLVNLSAVYLRGFIPEGEIGRVRAGQQARVFLDSAPDKAIDAVVIRIDPEASFTPENTYFRDDRVKQVVGVKLQLKDATGYAKPGMPADGEVITDGN
jgi:HlyD family secretion protein